MSSPFESLFRPFTAGALKALCHAQQRHNFEVVAVSGTSGGAVCAALVWYAHLKGEQPLWGRLMKFWEENTAQSTAEHVINRFIVKSTRLVNAGLLPTLRFSPSSPAVQMATQFMMSGQRKGFSDFKALLETHIDFAEIAAWGPDPHRPTLVIGAANVISGALEKFTSKREAITVEHILASCAVPNIFPAVRIGSEAYWDGLFSDNPPIEELIRPRTMQAAVVALAGQSVAVVVVVHVLGFAPVRPGQSPYLINLMEGVEEIPNPVLAAGLTWEWESFPEFMNALERRERAIDICGGNTRVRALQLTGNPWAEDPACYLDDAEIGLEGERPRLAVTPFRAGRHEPAHS